ncbi:hypothetical protein AB0D04_08840 [Streptomyces sp. NPDC048483]|uniref:hypothetical protein n=1 Tax=Streptomyces sp. NPDC048483 TaxID=3154927 RepID=UPI0034314656
MTETDRNTDSGSAALGELIDSWEAIHDEYRHVGDGEYDQAVLEIADRLQAEPGGPLAYLWTTGMVLTAPYVTEQLDDAVRTPALRALRAADAALSAAPCDHACHPYETHTDDYDEDLPGVLQCLVDETEEWQEDRPRGEWQCPRNVAGFARIALDIVEPGSVTDVPPRLPMEARNDIESLTALLEGYPIAGTEVDQEIAEQGWNLSLVKDPEERPGRIMAVRAVSWCALHDCTLGKWVFDDLIKALEKALPHYESGPCAHGADGHPELPGFSTSAAELGIQLSYPAGRALYAHSPRRGPLEALLCPAHMAATVRETLEPLKECRERFFGPRETAHLDAEYLDADGRLAIGKIAEGLEDTPRNRQNAEDLGLWAARRYGPADGERERAVLLLTMYQAMRIPDPAPAPTVAREVVPVLRSLAAVPRPERCTHDDEHPVLRNADIPRALPQLWPAPDGPEALGGGAAWTCPRFFGELADEQVRRLADLVEE